VGVLIMKKVPAVFLRRFDSHKFEKIMRKGAVHSYWDTKNREQFKRELASSAADVLLYTVHKIEIDDLTKEEHNGIIDYVIEIFNPLMDLYYNNLRKEYPMS
jgi:hypothetical protein